MAVLSASCTFLVTSRLVWLTLNTKVITLAAVALTILNKRRRQRIKLRIQRRNSQMCCGFDLSRSTRATLNDCATLLLSCAAWSRRRVRGERLHTSNLESCKCEKKKIPPSSFCDRFLHGNVCNSSSRERKNYEATPERFFFRIPGCCSITFPLCRDTLPTPAPVTGGASSC